MAITALAGPVSNLIICCVVLFIYGTVYYPLARAGTQFAYSVLTTISTTAYLSLALAIFNIIPIPPLDGSKVLFAFLSQEAYYKLMRYERYGMLLLLVLVASGVLRTPLAQVTAFLYDKLFVIAQFAFEVAGKVM